MKTTKPGYIYFVDNVHKQEQREQKLQFVLNETDPKTGKPYCLHDGTTIEEVLEAVLHAKVHIAGSSPTKRQQNTIKYLKSALSSSKLDLTDKDEPTVPAAPVEEKEEPLTDGDGSEQ